MNARSVLSPLLAVAAVLCFVASFVPFILGNYVAMAVSGSEYHELMANDRPKSYSSLAFGSWQIGQGQLSHSHILDLPPDSVITKHRVGHASSLLNLFTYYEAEYVLSGGTKRVTHASGQLPMFTARPSAVYGGLAMGWLLGLVLAIISFKLSDTAENTSTGKAK